MKLRNQLLRYNLQFFAEDGGSGADGGNGSEGDSNSEGGDGDPGTGQQQTLDDILKDGKYQSEFDKKVAKAIETAKSKWQTDAEKRIAEAKTEAEKLAKMNAEQKAQYAEEKRIKELEDRERNITVRELKAQANLTLTEKGLPLELSDLLNYSDAEQCNKSIASVEKAFQAAVEKAVNEKLRGGTQKDTKGAGNTLQEQIAKAIRGQF